MPSGVRIRVALIIGLYLLLIANLLFFVFSISYYYLIPVVLLLLIGLYLLFVYYPKFDPAGFTIYKLKKGYDRIAFTFDDGPDPLVTPEILDILKEYSIKATFFCLGFKAKKYPEIIKRIYEEGHLIGNHGYSHAKLHNKNKEYIKNEIDKTEEVLKPLSLLNNKRLFRSPHGFKNLTLIQLLREKNYVLVGWTRGIWDSDGSDADILLKRANAYLKDGVIYLFHDGRDKEGSGKNTAEFLRRFIPLVKEKGFDVVRDLQG